MSINKQKILWVDDEIDLLRSHIIYLENRTSVSRASDQIEDIKLIVEM